MDTWMLTWMCLGVMFKHGYSSHSHMMSMVWHISNYPSKMQLVSVESHIYDASKHFITEVR